MFNVSQGLKLTVWLIGPYFEWRLWVHPLLNTCQSCVLSFVLVLLLLQVLKDGGLLR